MVYVVGKRFRREHSDNKVGGCSLSFVWMPSRGIATPVLDSLSLINEQYELTTPDDRCRNLNGDDSRLVPTWRYHDVHV
jgi:hypothetical protein